MSKKIQIFTLFFISLLLGSCMETPELTELEFEQGNNQNKIEIPKDLDKTKEKFLAVKNILDAKCISCHSSGSLDFNFDAQEKYISAGFISPGKLSESSLYYRIQGVGLNAGKENMPVGSIGLNQLERDTIKDWILALGADTVTQYNAIVSVEGEIQEGSAQTLISISLDKPASESIEIPLTFSGSALNGLDYTPQATTVLIPVGASQGTLAINIIDDEIVESGELIQIDMATVSGQSYVVNFLQNQALIILNDNDIAVQNLVGTLQVQSPSLSIDEANLEIKIQLILNSAPREDIAFPVSISGTAINGVDYTLSAPTINILKNTTFGEVNLNIIDDVLPEVQKLIQINTPNYSDGINKIDIVSNTQQTLITLTDSDVDPNANNYDEYIANISTNPSAVNISETSGSVLITANLNKVALKNISIPVGVSGTVTPGSDYNLSASTIDIPAGVQSGSVTLNLVDDPDVENDESLNIDIVDVLDVANMVKVTANPAQIQKTLISDDLPVVKYNAVVSSNAVDDSITEGMGNLTVTVTLANALNKNTQFNYALSGSAVLNTDYTNNSATILIPSGMTSGSVNIPILDDNIEEADKTLIMTLLNYSNAGDKIEVDLNVNELTLTLKDNDAASITADFAGVKSIMTAQCTYCHAHKSDGQHPIDTTSEMTLSDSPFVVKGNANASKLFFKLKDAGAVDPNLETMPKFADALSLEMRNAIKTWINGLDGGNPANPDECEQSSFQNGLAFKMRRLSAEEIKNSIRSAFGDSHYSKIESTINNSLPVDPNPLSEDFQPQYLNGMIEAMGNIATSIGFMFKGDDTFFKDIAGECASISPVNDLCFENYLHKLAKSLYRRPMEADEVTNMKVLIQNAALADATPLDHTKNKYMVAMMHMLQSPNFLLVMDRSSHMPSALNNPFENLGLSLDKMLIARGEPHTYNVGGSLVIPEYTGLDLNPSKFSLMLSFTPSDLDGQGGQNPQFRMFSQSNGSSEQNHIIMIGTDNDGTGKGRILRLRLKTCTAQGSGCSTVTLKSQNAIFEENTKSKLVLTFESGTLSVYHNNNLLTLTGANLRGPFLATDPAISTFVGANFDDYMPFIGTVHNVVALNRVITASERNSYHDVNFDPSLEAAINSPPVNPVAVSRSIASVDGENIAQRTQYEIASLVSLTLTSSPPDADLFAAAKANQLSDINVLKSHAKRLLQTEQGKNKLKGFFDNWLELFNVTSSPYSNEYLAGINPDGLHQEVIEQVKNHGMKMVVEDEESYKSLMGGTQIHMDSNRLASLYGLASYNNNAKTSVSPLRAGILAMPGLNLTGGYFGSLVKRGVRIRRKVLCDPLGNPTAADVEDRDDVEPKRFDHSNREYWRLFTETNATCLSCHATTNPLGNVFENIDSIGRSRSTEVLFDTMGIATNFVYPSINISAKPLLTEIDPTEVTGPGELGQLIGGSSKAQACFARQAFQYTYKQQYVDNKHSCFVKSLEDKLQDGDGKMLDMFVELVATKYAQGQIQE